MLSKNLQETIKQGAKGAAVRQLQSALNALGADLVVDGDFGEVTDECVRDFQAWRRITEDGIVGPKTWAEIEQALARRQYMDNLAKSDRLRLLGLQAVSTALQWWGQDIFDPEQDDESEEAKISKDAITRFIREGLGWRYETYEGDGDFEWCLAFVFHCWPELKDSIRIVYGASTYRVDRYGSYRSAFGEPNPTPENEKDRRLYMKCDEHTDGTDLEWEPRAGDIALVGKKAGYGTHGVLVESYDKEAGVLHTIEGNAHGVGPNGERQQGVVRCIRPFGGQAKKGEHIVRRVVRPGLDSLKP